MACWNDIPHSLRLYATAKGVRVCHCLGMRQDTTCAVESPCLRVTHVGSLSGNIQWQSVPTNLDVMKGQLRGWVEGAGKQEACCV